MLFSDIILFVVLNALNNFPAVVVLSGIMTIHYKQSDLNDGFNASYKVLACPDHCPVNRTCVNGQCLCPEGWIGSNCSEALCPNNCSADQKRGVCDKVNFVSLLSCTVAATTFFGIV